MDFIRGTTLVYLKIRCWSGEKKASRERDIKVGTGGAIPPEKLLAIGRKKIFPPKKLDPLIRERKSAERACLGEGTRFMGGYAVPDDAIDELVTKLEGLQEKFRNALTEFMLEFERNKEQWIADNPEFEHILKDQVPSREKVCNAFEFTYTLYKLEPLEGFEPEENEVANQILHEIGMTCKEMSNRMLDRSTAIGGVTLKKQLEPLIKKMDTLAFGNGRILKVLNEFRILQISIPEERIDQDHPTFGHTITFLSMCADGDKLERIIEGQFSVSELMQGPTKIGGEDNASGNPNLSLFTSQTAVSSSTSTTSAYF